MTLTAEQDATTRICPLIPAPAQDPREPQQVTLCVGSRCMLWRWADREADYTERREADGPPEGPGFWTAHRAFTRESWQRAINGVALETWIRWRRAPEPGQRRGFCGAGGRPVVSRHNAARWEDGFGEGRDTALGR
jgi:hypothetical protein